MSAVCMGRCGVCVIVVSWDDAGSMLGGQLVVPYVCDVRCDGGGAIDCTGLFGMLFDTVGYGDSFVVHGSREVVVGVDWHGVGGGVDFDGVVGVLDVISCGEFSMGSNGDVRVDDVAVCTGFVANVDGGREAIWNGGGMVCVVDDVGVGGGGVLYVHVSGAMVSGTVLD